MKLDLTPVGRGYVAPTFGTDVDGPVDPRLAERLRRPMVIGCVVILVLVVGLITWASFTPLGTGITAPGIVRVESNRKTIRHRTGGTVRQIPVHEGQLVKAGQTLIVFDDVESRAAYDVYRGQVDTLAAQAARFTAEATNKPAMGIPPLLAGRLSDPGVAAAIRDQQFEFVTGKQLYESQIAVLNQRVEQIQTQIEGQRGQVASTDEQIKLTLDEMAGYQTLYEKGYAPRQLILRYQRSVADLQARKGSLMADIGRLNQQIGETRMQMVTVRDQRQSQAAGGLRETQQRLTDAMPRLTAATQGLQETVVRSPVDGYVFGLTQFTIGGVTGQGEPLMDIVPSNTPLIVSVMVKPTDIDDVHVGMKARVRLTALNPRWHSPMPGVVQLVSADAITQASSGGGEKGERGGQAFYRVDVRIDPKELLKLERNAQITPGMPAQVMIVTGEKTLMGALISPITDTLHQALREN